MSSAIVQGKINVCQNDIDSCKEEVRLLQQELGELEKALGSADKVRKILENNLSNRTEKVSTVSLSGGKVKLAGWYSSKMKKDLTGGNIKTQIELAAEARGNLVKEIEKIHEKLVAERKKLDDLYSDMHTLQSDLRYWQQREWEEEQARRAAEAEAAAAAARNNSKSSGPKR